MGTTKNTGLETRRIESRVVRVERGFRFDRGSNVEDQRIVTTERRTLTEISILSNNGVASVVPSRVTGTVSRRNRSDRGEQRRERFSWLGSRACFFVLAAENHRTRSRRVVTEE